MALNMRCRFAPNEHGTFVNAVKLQQHYIAEHADVYEGPPSKATCPECGVLVARTYLAEHRRRHGVESAPLGRPSHESTGRPKLSNGPFRCDLCGQRLGGRDTARHHVRDSHGNPGPWRDYMTPVDEPASNGLARVDREVSRVAPSHVGPWHVDDIVLPVVSQLAAPKGVVAVANLAALLAWRDATAMFLAEYQRS